MKKDRRQDIGQDRKYLPRYQDYVIRDGKLVGDWEGLYKNFEDPWHQSRSDHLHDSRRSLALSWCSRLREEYKQKCVKSFMDNGMDREGAELQTMRKMNGCG